MPKEPDADVDPRDFMRAVLHLDPKDAEKAREQSPASRKRKPPEGPHHDFGDDDPQDGSQP